MKYVQYFPLFNCYLKQQMTSAIYFYERIIALNQKYNIQHQALQKIAVKYQPGHISTLTVEALGYHIVLLKGCNNFMVVLKVDSWGKKSLLRNQSTPPIQLGDISTSVERGLSFYSKYLYNVIITLTQGLLLWTGGGC